MKRWIAVLLTALMALGLAACGSKESDLSGSVKKAAQSAEESAPEGTLLKTDFFNLYYGDEWSYDESKDLSTNNSGYAYATLHLMNGEDSLADVEVSVDVEEVSNYRAALHELGVDARGLVEKNAYPLVEIGGVKFVQTETNAWGSPLDSYEGRDEAAGATAKIQVTRYDLKADDERVASLVKSITFTLTDTGNTDPPWPWEGEPFDTSTPKSATVGGFTISSSFLKLADSMVTYDIFCPRVAAGDGKAYILNGDTIKQYAYDENSLSYEKDLALDTNYSEISYGGGLLFASQFMEDFLTFKDGSKTAAGSDVDNSAMAPDGTWGISWFSDSALKRLTYSGGSVSTSDWTISELTLVNSVDISANHIIITGSTASENKAIAIYDLSGNFQTLLGDKPFGADDSIGSMTAVIETANGYLGVDGNYRELFFWGTDGSFLGKAEADDLFGASYPWMSDAVPDADGHILICMTQERTDESCDEVLMFRLTGF